MDPNQDSIVETLLLVDDEAGIRNVLSISLADAGYQVISAADGQQALDLFRQHHPAIVLTDIKMPGMSGIDLLQAIKAECPDTEVIMMTGHGDLDLAIKSLKMDATDFVTKPINDDILGIALNRAHQRMEMRRQVQTYTRELEQMVREKQSHLNASQQSYRQLFDQSPCYITVQNRDLEIMAANQRFTADFDGRIGMHCYQAYKQRTTPCPDCPVESTFADGESHQSEMAVTTKDSEQCHLFVSTAPIKDAAGRTVQVIEMSTNITELHHLQDHLSSLGLRISSISHGIKGLLTNLDGGLYLLRTGIEKQHQSKTKEGFDIVQFASERIRRMILDILYFAKERPLQVEQVDGAKFARDIAAAFLPRVNRHPINFRCDIAEDIGLMEMDTTVMRTALFNMLDNAVDACLEIRPQQESNITFSVQRRQDYVIFNIIDDGIGMDKDATDNLFDLFFSSKGHRGTGIGLFVAHQIVTQHNGTIHVSSQKGKGTHFRVVLPDRMDPVALSEQK
jgi:signal transduction histidine kinase/FixJ family two-component response regulator